MNQLVLLFTLRCPLECAHCAVESSPRRRESLPLDVMHQLICDAANSGVRTIGFTGGDPFVAPDVLDSSFQLVQAKGMKAIIVTSGFFASSVERAKQILEPYRTVELLGISTDAYHQEFTDISRVQNAIVAARELGIRRVEVQIVYASLLEADKTANRLRQFDPNVEIRLQPLWPIGKAEPLVASCSSISKTIDELDLSCPMVGPVVTPDGSIQGCCSSLLSLGKNNPLLFGNMSTDGLPVIQERMSAHGYYQLLKRFGLQPVIRLLTEAGFELKLERRFTDVCHLCHFINSDIEMREAIETCVNQEVC